MSGRRAGENCPSLNANVASRDGSGERPEGGKKNNVIAVIGYGSMTAGQANEAMNNAGHLDSDMIVILNDNKQVSLPTATLDGHAPPVGALSSALSKLQSSRPLRELREVAKWRPLVLPDRYIDHGSPVDQMAEAGLTPAHVAATVFNMLGKTWEALQIMSIMS